MENTVKLIPVVSYRVEANGVDIGQFMVGSDWNGMTELSSGNDKLIVASKDGLADFLIDELFGSGKRQPRNVSVVSASPFVLGQIHAAWNKEEPAPVTPETA